MELAGIEQLNEATTADTLYKKAVEANANWMLHGLRNNYEEMIADDPKQKMDITKFGTDFNTLTSNFEHMADDVSDRMKAILSKNK